MHGDVKMKTEKIPKTLFSGWAVEGKVKTKMKQKPKPTQSQAMCPLEVWRDRVWDLSSQMGLNGFTL